MLESNRDSGWPTSATALAMGAAFLRQAAADGQVVIVYHGDADGLCAGAIMLTTLRCLGATRVTMLSPGKGESPYAAEVRRRIRSYKPQWLIVVDMGSRDEAIIPGTDTLVIDHHQPEGFPEGAVLVSSHGHPPIAPSSLLSFILGSTVANLDQKLWLAVVGTVADLGPSVDFSIIREGLRRYGRGNITETVALLNAAKRSAAHDVATALAVVERATSPADIARGRVAGVEKLRDYRQRVAAEVSRVARTRPVFADRVALLRFSSGAQVHPLVAIRWARRLSNNIVIAANYGYLPGRVNFAMRSMLDVNLVDFLHNLGVTDVDGEFGYGHARATGGSVTPQDFDRLLRAMGFDLD